MRSRPPTSVSALWFRFLLNKEAPSVNESRQQKVQQYYTNKIPHLEVLMDNVWDPHNVSAVARTTDGLGISTIHLYYTYNKFPQLKKVGKKASASANQWIHFENIKDLSHFVTQKKSHGFVFLGAHVNSLAQPLHHFKFPSKCMILLGAESQGLSPELQEVCDDFLYIPMVGMVTSYNISVAAAIILYEAFCQKGKNLQLKPLEDFQTHPNRHSCGRAPHI